MKGFEKYIIDFIQNGILTNQFLKIGNFTPQASSKNRQATKNYRHGELLSNWCTFMYLDTDQ